MLRVPLLDTYSEFRHNSVVKLGSDAGVSTDRHTRGAIVQRTAQLQIAVAEMLESVLGAVRFHRIHRGEAVGTAGAPCFLAEMIRETLATSSSTPNGLVM